MSVFPTFDSDFTDHESLTKQEFKEDADINKMLAKAQRSGTISHLQKYQGEYGDFSQIDDLLDAHEKLKRGQEIFNELPSEIRREFGQSPGDFFKFVNKPENQDHERLQRVMTALAKPGDNGPSVVGSRPTRVDATPPAAEPPAAPTEAPAEPQTSSST